MSFKIPGNLQITPTEDITRLTESDHLISRMKKELLNYV